MVSETRRPSQQYYSLGTGSATVGLNLKPYQKQLNIGHMQYGLAFSTTSQAYGGTGGYGFLYLRLT